MERKILHKVYLLRLPRNIAVTYLALTSATDVIVIVEVIAPYLFDGVGRVANQTCQLLLVCPAKTDTGRPSTINEQRVNNYQIEILRTVTRQIRSR